jgi:hypothetical protein
MTVIDFVGLYVGACIFLGFVYWLHVSMQGDE